MASNSYRTLVKNLKQKKMNKLLKDAIADAKAVRETALANAKHALEEAFAPKLQSMLSHKIKEEMEEDGKEGEEVVSDEDKMEVAKMQNLAGLTNEEDDMDSEEEMDMDSEEGSEEEMDMDSEEGSEEDYSEEGDEEAPAEEEEVTDDDLEEILRELEGESEEEETEEEPEMEDESYNESEDPEDAMDEEIDLEEIINALKEEDEAEEETEETESKMEAVTSDLNEAYSVIKFLRSKLNEVNLLNAKLLFVNKLFRKGELTESQKVKIIETFDRAKNVREAKLIYATLSESVSNKTIKKPVKNKMTEGLASAPQKKTQIISESAGVFNRFKTLVDYNKI